MTEQEKSKLGDAVKAVSKAIKPTVKQPTTPQKKETVDNGTVAHNDEPNTDKADG